VKALPLAVEIEINDACNRTCAYCPNDEHERIEKGAMERDLFILLMTQLQDMGFRGRISYHFYNEPLFSKDLEDYVVLTKEYLPECRIDLFTNGTLLNQQRLESLIRCGVDKFTVTRHVNADLRDFEAALLAISPENRERIRYLTYKQVPLTNRGGTLAGVGPRSLKPPLKLPCFIPECTLVVTLKGNVIPCYEDYFQKHVMGNIREKHIRDIWTSAQYVYFRNQLKKGERAAFSVCQDCNNSMVIA
jgi:radical SAM protein with 4Fe4S-binding SPASM domain